MYHEKREKFETKKIETLLLRVTTLASISLKVRRETAKRQTPILPYVRLYSHGGVDYFCRRLKQHFSGPGGNLSRYSRRR
jgi:hypothetical protein